MRSPPTPADLDKARQTGGPEYIETLRAWADARSCKVKLPDGSWYKPRRWKANDPLRPDRKEPRP